MNRTPGNGGRKKNVTGGGKGVYKRGNGIGSGKPVGKSDGYSARKAQGSGSGHGSSYSSKPKPSGSSSGSSSNSSYSRNSAGSRSSGSGLLGLLLGLVSTSTNSNKKSPLEKIIKLLKTNKTARIIAIILVILLVFYLLKSGACSGGMNGFTADSYGVAGITAQETNVSTSVSNLARDKRTQIVGGGEDVVTVMVYMCGTDLESKYGMATSDLKEMMGAQIGENVNVIVETGGANAWKNKTVSHNFNQIYQVTSRGLVCLEDKFAQKSMVDPTMLTEFIQYSVNNFPADRYMLIMWDHGGGSVSGYGYDEKFAKTGSMTLDEIDSAIKDSGCIFDFIGFDACLMATLETALVCEKYADYMIASEETEPGVGWYYTNWLTKLSQNTSAKTVDIGKWIIDDFVSVCKQAAPRDKTTLSIIDLAEMAGTIPESFNAFARSTTALIDSNNYQVVSNARSKTREFASNINQVDLIQLAENIGTPEAKEFAQALRGCVKYNRTSSNIANANGVSIFFPYGNTSSMNSAISTYNKIGLDSSYSDCIKSFASVSAGGQIISGGSGMSSMLESVLGGGSSSGSGDSLVDLITLLGGSSGSSSSSSGGNAELIGTALDLFLGSSNSGSATGIDVGQLSDWFSTDRVMQSKAYYAENYLDPDNLVMSQKGDEYVLSLTDEEWDLVQDVQLNVFVDDGEGYLDLGMDNTYRFDEDGDLVLDYDGTWLAINGHVVSYYMISNDVRGDNYVITGRVPVLLNGELMDLILVFDNENENGVVAGARIHYSGESETFAKGLVEIKAGDTIDFLCDYYTYEGEYIDSYYLGEQFVVPEGELTISNVSIGGNPCKVTYCLTDIYSNELWTESVEY